MGPGSILAAVLFALTVPAPVAGAADDPGSTVFAESGPAASGFAPDSGEIPVSGGTPAPPYFARRTDAVAELSKPFHESRLKRFENVFFISLPFSTLYVSLATAAAGYAIKGKGFRYTPEVVALDLSLSAGLAGWIAGRDSRDAARAARETAAPVEPAPAPATTGPEPSSTPLR